MDFFSVLEVASFIATGLILYCLVVHERKVDVKGHYSRPGEINFSIKFTDLPLTLHWLQNKTSVMKRLISEYFLFAD